MGYIYPIGLTNFRQGLHFAKNSISNGQFLQFLSVLTTFTLSANSIVLKAMIIILVNINI